MGHVERSQLLKGDYMNYLLLGIGIVLTLIVVYVYGKIQEDKGRMEGYREAVKDNAVKMVHSYQLDSDNFSG